MDGSGLSSSKTRIDSYESEEVCAAKVKSLKPSATGATYGNDRSCFAEFGHFGTNGSKNWKTCSFQGGVLFFNTK